MTKDINYTLLKKEKQSLEDENKKIQNLLYQSYEKIKSLESLQMENWILKKDKTDLLQDLRKQTKQNKELNDKLIKMME